MFKPQEHNTDFFMKAREQVTYAFSNDLVESDCEFT